MQVIEIEIGPGLIYVRSRVGQRAVRFPDLALIDLLSGRYDYKWAGLSATCDEMNSIYCTLFSDSSITGLGILVKSCINKRECSIFFAVLYINNLNSILEH